MRCWLLRRRELYLFNSGTALLLPKIELSDPKGRLAPISYNLLLPAISAQLPISQRIPISHIIDEKAAMRNFIACDYI